RDHPTRRQAGRADCLMPLFIGEGSRSRASAQGSAPFSEPHVVLQWCVDGGRRRFKRGAASMAAPFRRFRDVAKGFSWGTGTIFGRHENSSVVGGSGRVSRAIPLERR